MFVYVVSTMQNLRYKPVNAIIKNLLPKQVLQDCVIDTWKELLYIQVHCIRKLTGKALCSGPGPVRTFGYSIGVRIKDK